MKENIEDWKPYFKVFGKNAYSKNFDRNIEYLERSWFCNETGNIHHSEKAVLNCAFCSKLFYKPKQAKL
jgi:hypothetical protein